MNAHRTPNKPGHAPNCSCGECRCKAKRPNPDCKSNCRKAYCPNCCHPECPKIDVCCPKTWGIQCQLLDTEDYLLPDRQPVAFDTILNIAGDNISYDLDSKTFSIERPGTFQIQWQVAYEGSDKKPFVRFALDVNGVIYAPMAAPITVGYISGSALITVAKPESTLSLINFTDDTLQLSRFSPVANIVIVSA